MALVNNNSSFVALKVVLNVFMTLQFYRRFSSTLKASTNSVLVVPTSKEQRSATCRNASLTPPLELTMKSTAVTPSTSLALVWLREQQGCMLHLCLLSSRNPLRLCSRFSHPLPLVWIFAVSLLSKNLKLTRNSSILLVFLTIPLRHAGPCMLSRRRNALPKLSPTPRAPMPRHTLEFGTIINSQHLRSRIFFCPDDIERCVRGSRRKWVDKFSADQE
jgi:hypothetical protein